MLRLEVYIYLKASLKIRSSVPIIQLFVVVQSFSCIWCFVTPWTTTRQASLSFTVFWNLLKLMSIESVMPSNHLILGRPLLLLPSIFPASGSFPMSRLFSSGGQSIGASASVLPTNIQGWLYDFWCYKTEFFKDILGIFWGSLKPLSEGLWSQNHFIIIWKHFSLLSNSHVWMWELNHKESWAPKN